MSDYTYTTGKRRTAHLNILHVDLSQRINHLKHIWKKMETTQAQIQPAPNSLSPMQQTAKNQIKQQQTPKRSKPKKVEKQIQRTKHQKFIERRAKKHPEIITLHSPPMNFYQKNRPFESRPASYTEDRQRLEGCHQLLFKLEQKKKLKF